MTTLADVYEFMGNWNNEVAFWGATAEVLLAYQEKKSALSDALCEENGLTREEAHHLPRETVLMQKAQQRFDELVNWSKSIP